MLAIHPIRLGLISLIMTATTAFACPNDKNCDQKQKACTTKNKSCDKRSQNSPMCHTAASDMLNKKSCHKNKHMKHSRFLKHLKSTLQELKLNASQWSDIKLAFNIYKTDMRNLMIKSPKDSFKNASFNRQKYITKHPLQIKLNNQADLLETVFIILNDTQKKAFATTIENVQLSCKVPANNAKKSCN
jgi:hypothetical protein